MIQDLRHIKISGIYYDSIVDGTGLRNVVFFQGCPHHCFNCHNPQTWDENNGNNYTLDSLIQEAFKGASCIFGITLSGGEPLIQPNACLCLAKKAKEMSLSVWLYTGYTFEELNSVLKENIELLKYIDVLIDGEFKDNLKSLNLNWRGSSNQRIIDVPESLKSGHTVLRKDLYERI